MLPVLFYCIMALSHQTHHIYTKNSYASFVSGGLTLQWLLLWLVCSFFFPFLVSVVFFGVDNGGNFVFGFVLSARGTCGS